MRMPALVLVLLVGCATMAATQTPVAGTPAEAQALLSRAIAHYDKVGRAQALADFTAKKPPFVEHDLYVFCIGPDRTVVSHGADPKQVGVKIETLKDVDGKVFGPELWTAGNAPGGGSVEYRWTNPVTKKVQAKVSYVRKAGTDVCGVGAYK